MSQGKVVNDPVRAEIESLRAVGLRLIQRLCGIARSKSDEDERRRAALITGSLPASLRDRTFTP